MQTFSILATIGLSTLSAVANAQAVRTYQRPILSPLTVSSGLQRSLRKRPRRQPLQWRLLHWRVDDRHHRRHGLLCQWFRSRHYRHRRRVDLGQRDRLQYHHQPDGQRLHKRGFRRRHSFGFGGGDHFRWCDSYCYRSFRRAGIYCCC